MKNIVKLGFISLSLTTLVACSSQTNPATTTVSSAVAPQRGISIEEAKAIALKAAGADETAVTNLTMNQDTQMNQAVYEIDFDYQGQEYSYSISQADGSIVEQGMEPVDTVQAVPATSSSMAATTALVTLEQAQTIALADLGLDPQAVMNLVVTEDYDNGRAVYDVEFNHQGMEYSYTLDAQTGDILSKEQDSD